MQLRFKILSSVLSFFALTSVAQAGELPFTDVAYNAHFEAIYRMKEWGIFDGYADGSFGYIKEINRAELSKALVLGSGMEESEVDTCADNASKSFSDVSAGQWYTSYVYCAQSKGWVSGDDGKTTFRPGDPVLLPEAFKMILESQYGTPDSSYQGDLWYDIYLNPLLEKKIIYKNGDYSSEYYGYTFMSGYSQIGFNSVITSKTTRQDIAELLYRVRTVLEAGDGELTVYDPLITLSGYETQYGASIEENDGVLTIRDPHFDFEVTNVYIGELDQDDLEIFIKNPSGFENGSDTDWKLMVPSLNSNYEEEELTSDEMFTIQITDADSEPDETLIAWCASIYSRPFEWWEIYDTLCGEEGVNRDSLASLLQLTAYGEDYQGETVLLDPIKNGPLSILKFSDVMAEAANYAYWYEYGSGDYIDYLESLEDLQSVDSDQESDLQTWREEYLEAFEADSEEDIVDSLNDLEALLDEYELQVVESFGSTLTLQVHLGQATSYNHPDYIDYDIYDEPEVLEGEFGDYLWDNMALIFSEANDPYNGEYFGTDQSVSGHYLQITVENQPVLFGDSNGNSSDWNHLAVYSHGLYRNAYYFEITDVEVIE